ncbi:hypothetical protein DB346_00030 [Verrucomicrobia bacterium LW23]|nr:hypothetical protein DB346_00030 [Verrucomicrobia bacterium LW23]
MDGAFILAPPLLAAAVVLGWRAAYGGEADPLPVWAWVLLVMAIDVGHVYSTLFRTYFDRDEMARHGTLYTVVPAICFVVGMMLYNWHAIAFWRALAYLAAFHFVRQQYGFMRIYSRREKDHPVWWARLDAAVIYLATVYPLLYWHAHLPRAFEWFVKDDFLALPHGFAHVLERAGWAAYLVAGVLYVGKEVWLWHSRRYFNAPKNLLVAGTAAAWYMGIVWLNGDIAFTVTNIISHGIPYMALVWLYARRKQEQETAPVPASSAAGASAAWLWQLLSVRTLLRWAPLFVVFLVLLGWVEEGLWDALVWREHASVFGIFQSLPQVRDHNTLAWLVPLLALPQMTHYVLDGFIWRMQPSPAAAYPTAITARPGDDSTAWMKHTLHD